MPFQLTPLPFLKNGLDPYFSEETLLYHHGKHHQAYVNQLNKLILGTEWENASLESIIQSCPKGTLYNQAAQVWNHEFYWHCLCPPGSQTPHRDVKNLLESAFGSIANFQTAFFAEASKVFGSGWTWLMCKPDLSLSIQSTPNGDAPLHTEDKPILALDIWEHAYYIDFRNNKAAYFSAFWECLNWSFMARNMTHPTFVSESAVIPAAKQK